MPEVGGGQSVVKGSVGRRWEGVVWVMFMMR